MKLKLLALVLLTGTSMFAGTHVYVGVGGVGVGWGGYYPPAPVYAPAYPVAPPAYAVAAPYPAAVPGSVWINGYYYPAGPRYNWHAGYYARPPFARAYWNAPRYYGGRYYGGYWGRHR